MSLVHLLHITHVIIKKLIFMLAIIQFIIRSLPTRCMYRLGLRYLESDYPHQFSYDFSARLVFFSDISIFLSCSFKSFQIMYAAAVVN